MKPVYLTVDRREVDGALQVSINHDSSGYRIAGAKYDGSSRTLLKRKLTKSDVDVIRGYLRKVKDDE